MILQNLRYYVAHKVAADYRNSLTRGKIKFVINIFGNSRHFYAKRKHIVKVVGQRCNLSIIAYDEIAQKTVEISAGKRYISAIFFFTAFAGKTFAAAPCGMKIHALILLYAVTVRARFGNYTDGEPA